MSRAIMNCIATALTLAALAVSGLAQAAPAAVAAVYDVRMNGTHMGTLTENYQARDAAYTIASTTAPSGMFALVPRLAVRLSSVGTVTSQGLRPSRFEGRRARSEAPEVIAEFDWTVNELTLTHDGRTEKVPLPRGAQDRLSVMYEFMFVGPRIADKAGRVEMALTNGRRLDRYTYAVKRDVELDTPLGRLKTIHLVREREADDSGHELWLAPGYGYVPVRMLIIEREGTRFDQLATRIDVTP